MNCQKILVTGANGFIGSSLCSELSLNGYSVVAAVRDLTSVNSAMQDGIVDAVKVGNIDGKTDWTSALVDCSTVVHLAARAHVLCDSRIDQKAAFRDANVAGTVQLAKSAIQAGVRRFVFVSSIGVNGPQSDRPFSETDLPAPSEDYAFSKLEAEFALRELVDGKAMQLVIIRPPLVYGPNCPGNFSRLLKLVSSGIPLPLGGIKNRRSFISIWNLTNFLMTCVTHKDAAGNVFLVSDMEDISLPDLLRHLADGMGKNARLFSISPVLLYWSARLLGKSDLYEKLCCSLTVDARHARDILGWVPILNLTEGLRRTAQWYAADIDRKVT